MAPIIQRVSPLGRYAFGSVIDVTKNLNDEDEWLLWLELSVEQSEPLIQLVEDEIKLGYDEFGKGWGDKAKLNKPYKQATMPDPEGGSKRVENPDALIWVFKRKGQYMDHKTRTMKPKTPPVIVDSDGIPVKMDDRPAVGYGSTVKALFHSDHYQWKGSKGIAISACGLNLSAMQSRFFKGGQGM